MLFCKSLIDFNEAFIPYNELQLFSWPNIVAHSLAAVICIANGLVILVHRNIQVTILLIGYIQLCQGFECWHMEEELPDLSAQFYTWCIINGAGKNEFVSQCNCLQPVFVCKI